MMKNLIILTTILFTNVCISQNTPPSQYEKHGVIWSVGLFKAWLKDNSVEFNKIGDRVTPVFIEEKKSGFAIQSHYMYKPNKWFGMGVHAGLGLDVSSYMQAPVVLFGASISLGRDHQIIIDFGLADGKRKIVPNAIKNDLINVNLTEIPIIHNHTEFNTGYYIGLSYRIF